MNRQIPFADLKSQYNAYKEELDKAVLDVMGSSMYIMGPEVEKLEKNLANYVGSKYALSVSSGTDALLLALMAYDIKAGDEVITTPFTFIATAEVIALVGAKPVFADIDEKTYNLDVEKVKPLINERTKAIIPVSLYGLPADMDKFYELVKGTNIKLIEDACQSFGAVDNGKYSCNYNSLGCTSFFPSGSRCFNVLILLYPVCSLKSPMAVPLSEHILSPTHQRYGDKVNQKPSS